VLLLLLLPLLLRRKRSSKARQAGCGLRGGIRSSISRYVCVGGRTGARRGQLSGEELEQGARCDTMGPLRRIELSAVDLVLR
jgi:hypothetical protein